MPTVESPPPTVANWLMILALGLIWGGTFLVIELALQGITPFWLAAARIGFAALLMLVIWVARGARLFNNSITRKDLGRLTAVGALSSAVPFMLLSWGQQFVTSGFAGVSMAAVALMVLPLAHFFVAGEHLNLRKSFGFILGFCGVWILIGAQAFESTGHSMEVAGRIACLGAAGCYALSSVQMRLLPPIDPIGLSTVTLLIGAILVVGCAFVVEGVPPAPNASTLGYLAFLGLIPTAGANLLRVLVIRSVGPTFMSLTNYQVPIWSVFLGFVFLGEPLRISMLIALALILAGVALSQWGALRRLLRS